MVIYILDTNSFLDLPFHYSRDIFPSVWNKFESLIDSRRIISPIQVCREIGDYHTILTPWCKNHESIFQDDDQIHSIATDIMKEFPNLVDKDNIKDPADPYLIALALMKQKESSTDQFIIITQETSNKSNTSQKKPISTEQKEQMSKKIPDVAKTYDIDSMNLLEFFRNEKWTF